MVQVINRAPSIGNLLGELLGGGIGGATQGAASGLQQSIGNFFEEKKAQRQRQQLANTFKDLGFPEQLSQLPEPLARELLKQEGQQRQTQQLLNLLGGRTSEEEINAETITPGGISDEQIAQVSILNPNLARTLQSQKEAQFKHKAEAFKVTKDVRSSLIKEARSAKENNMRLDRMTELMNSGKLISPLFNDFLKKLHLDLPALKNPKSQEFEKISTDMMRNAREIFGARVTNFEMQTFLKSIPTLSLTDEGKERVIRDLKILNSGPIIRQQLGSQIIKENRGIPPLDLEEQIEERFDPISQQLAEDFKAGIEKEPPQKKELPKGSIKMRDPAGNIRAVPKEQALKAQEAGYKKL